MAIPVITSATTDSAVTGSAYSYQITATNSPTSFGAYVATGFPPGLSVDSVTGIISGTPTTAGNWGIKLSAVNADGVGKATLRLVVTGAGLPVITSSLTATGTQGSAFSYTITSTGGTTSYNATMLPPGLTFSVDTISGAPTTLGSFSIPISATNSSGTTTATLVLTVSGPAGSPVITSSGTIDALVGVPLTYQITATNTPTSFGATGLPSGLTITGDTVSGYVSTVGIYNIVVTATNATGTGAKSVVITISSHSNITIPNGLSYLATHAKPLTSSAFGPSVDMISIGDFWYRIEPTEGVYDWTYLDSAVRLASANSKQVLIRIGTMGGFASLGGSTPDWVATALGVDPSSNAIVPGVTYTSGPTGQYLTTPVFFNNIFVSKKIAMLQAMGDHFINGTTLTAVEKGAIKVFGVSFINVNTEDWSIPNSNIVTIDPLYNNLSELSRWTNAVDAASPGAGYTSAQMLAAGEAIIDAAAAACGDRFISLAIASNGTSLDLAAAGSSALAGNWMAIAVHDYENTANPGRMIYQRQSVASAQTPAPPPANTVWEPLYNFDLAGDNVAGQMLWFVYGDMGYRVNKGSANDPNGVIPNPPGLTYGQIMRQSGERASGYGMSYLEVYRPDFENLPDDVAYVRSLLLDQTMSGQPPVITSPNIVYGTVGVPFTYQITASNLPTSFGVDVLPDGLTLNPVTGLISGTPISSVVLLIVTVSATNDTGTGSLAVKFKINNSGGGGGDGAPVITSSLDVTTEVNSLFSYQITATNNPTEFQIIAGLPVELTLDPTGLISGVPLTIRDYNIKFSVRNAIGGTSAILILHVVAVGGGQPEITSPDTAAATLGVPFNYQITATNNPTSFGADALPDGLTLASTGLISGIPTVRGVFTAQISATNAAGTGGIELFINVGLAVISPPIVRYHVSVCPENSTFSEDFIVDVCCDSCPDEALPPYPPTKLVATTPGIPGSRTVNIQWTPPANSF